MSDLKIDFQFIISTLKYMSHKTVQLVNFDPFLTIIHFTFITFPQDITSTAANDVEKEM